MTRRERNELIAQKAFQQGYRCFYCDRPMSMISNACRPTGDHVRPLSKGGADDPTNIVACCWACNRAKADFTSVDLRRMADRIDAYAGRGTGAGEVGR